MGERDLGETERSRIAARVRAAMPKDFENALVMIASVRAALKNNVKHYSLAGKPLTTVMEILEALQADQEIIFDMQERVQRTTDEDELELARLEFGPYRGEA